jgi:putative restriction endonuclease
LISDDDDWSILISKDRLPDTVTGLLREDRRLLPPKRWGLEPHGNFLRYHREYIFKG